MNLPFKRFCIVLILSVVFLVCVAPGALAQVDPREITDPKLKLAEQTYLPKLVEIQRTIGAMTFPFTFSVNRYVGVDLKDQASSDKRGVEFVNFQGRVVLKVTGNYNAAYNANLLTANQRAGKTVDDVIVPILRTVASQFSPDDAFDAFGFEISHHFRSRSGGFDYEGRENVVVVVDKADAIRFAAMENDSSRQEFIDHAETYLNGQPLGPKLNILADQTPGAAPNAALKAATEVDAKKLQARYQSQLDKLAIEGAARFHFVDYAPPSIVIFQDQPYVQLTLRNPQAFDKDKTSIYKRAAQSFDLFLAPQLKGILEKTPVIEATGISVAVVMSLSSPSGASSSEVLELFFPRNALQRFADAGITNQDLINKSVVLVNGVRIALDLQRVE